MLSAYAATFGDVRHVALIFVECDIGGSALTFFYVCVHRAVGRRVERRDGSAQKKMDLGLSAYREGPASVRPNH